MRATPVIATSGNRLNNSGSPEPMGISRTAQIISTVIPAGQNFTYPISGNNFYLIVSTAELAIRPRGGVYNNYTSGKGQVMDNGNLFNLLEVKNNTVRSVVFSLFVGFGGYIDNTLILNTQVKEILLPTYDGLTSAAATVDIPDMTGLPFVDSNGKSWLAVQRLALQVFNADSGAAILVKNAAGSINVANVTPLSGITLPMSGDFSAGVNGGGNVNGIVSELYSAISPT